MGPRFLPAFARRLGLTNRTAVARRVERLLADGVAARCTIVPCAELWSGPFMASQVGDFSEVSAPLVRPSYEDLLGAGSIVAAMGAHVRRSVEASMAADVFESHKSQISEFLAGCVSGRELIERGFAAGVTIAAQLDARAVVPERSMGDPAKMFATTLAATE